MTRVFTSLVCLLFSAAALAEDRGPALPDYPVDRVTDNVYVIHGPRAFPNPENQGFMNNPGIVLTSAGVVVLDPGSSVQSGEMVIRAVRKLSDQPVVAVFNSHMHGDHWLGNQAFEEAYPGIPIYGHRKMMGKLGEGIGSNWVRIMHAATKGASRGTRAIPPNKAVEHGEEIQIGGHTFRIHHYGHAHSNTDIMVEIPQESIVFMGDNAFVKRIGRLTDTDVKSAIEATQLIKQTGAGNYVPGHGPTNGEQVVDGFGRYLTLLWDSVKKHYDEGLSDFEMKDQVAEAVKDYMDWPGLEEELGRHISITYLQVEASDW